MKEAKEFSSFLLKAFAVFLAINLAVVLVYAGSLVYGNYIENHYKIYLNEISDLSSILSDPFIDSLRENCYKFDNIVITTFEKDDFQVENIKTIEFNRYGMFNFKMYLKGRYVSFNPKWLISHKSTINGIKMKYIHKYDSMIKRYHTTSVFLYNDIQYKITVDGEKVENINKITEIIKAMV